MPESKPFRADEMLAMMPAMINGFIATTEARYKQACSGRDAAKLP